MANFQQELNQFIQEELQHWSQAALVMLAAKIQAAGLVLTEDLIKSLNAEVQNATTSGVTSAFIEFHQYGRIREMKGIQQAKLPPIEELEEYVRKVGVSNFEFVPGYKHGQFPKDQNKAISRIAWGIGVNKFLQNNHHPKKWFSKNFYKTMNPLLDRLVMRMQQVTGETVAASFKI